MKIYKKIAMGAILACSYSFSTLVSALDEGTTIIGTKEAPNVLNVVPWQDDEFTGNPWEIQPEPGNSVLENTQKSLDKDVLRREVEYFNLLRNMNTAKP